MTKVEAEVQEHVYTEALCDTLARHSDIARYMTSLQK